MSLPNERHMIDIVVYYNGKMEIEDLGMTRYATQVLYRGGTGGHGIVYRCPKNRKNYYIKKAIQFVQKECDAEIKAQMKIKNTMDKLLAKVEAK